MVFAKKEDRPSCVLSRRVLHLPYFRQPQGLFLQSGNDVEFTRASKAGVLTIVELYGRLKPSSTICSGNLEVSIREQTGLHLPGIDETFLSRPLGLENHDS